MRVSLFVSSLVLMQSLSAAADVAEDVAHCVASLEYSTTLYAEQIQFVIERGFGPGPFPAELTRSYRRGDQTLLTLTCRQEVRLRNVRIDLDTFPLPQTRAFVDTLTGDLRSRGIAAMIRPAPPPEGAVRGTPVKAFDVTTDYRHLLTAEEAAQLFSVIDQILIQRIPGHVPTDAIKLGVLDSPGVTF